MKQKHIAFFVNEEDAARAFDADAMARGMTDRVNFPSEWENGERRVDPSKGVHREAEDPTIAVGPPSVSIVF
jgi:hypothetical protein